MFARRSRSTGQFIRIQAQVNVMTMPVPEPVFCKQTDHCEGCPYPAHDGNDSVKQKVKTYVFSAEVRDGKLWGVAECKVIGELTAGELDTLKDYISGQASDGFGEGFEQREIITPDGEIYAHLWQWENWSVQTESELFTPKLAKGLPELCFSTLPSTGELICIKRGESGYYPSDWDTGDRQRNVELADYNNERLGVTAAQRQAMECGSMWARVQSFC